MNDFYKWSVLLLLCSGSGYPFNHPDIHWKTAETEHFNVHFGKGMERLASEAVTLAEEIYDPVTQAYNWTPPKKVDLIIEDRDDANGSALAITNSIVIWPTHLSKTFPARGMHEWLRDVITHEFTHIVSIQSSQKLPYFLPYIGLGYFDYPIKNPQKELFGFLSSEIFPYWFSEGVAQFESMQNSGDSLDTHRDYFLRIGSYYNTLEPYQKLKGGFFEYALDFEKKYNHGFSLVAYIAETFGREKVYELAHTARKIYHFSFESVILKVLGISGQSLYQGWKSYLDNKYSQQIKRVQSDLKMGRRISRKPFYNSYPLPSRKEKAIYFISNQGEIHWPGFIYAYYYEKDTVLLKGAGTPLFSSFTFNTKEDTVYYIDQETDFNGNAWNDVFYSVQKKKARQIDSTFQNWEMFKRKRLTTGLRGFDPVISTDQNHILYVKNGRGNDSLFIMDKDGKNSHCLFGFSEDQRSQIFRPFFSPDGQQIVFSIYHQGRRDIAKIDSNGKNFQILIGSAADERDPFWSSDGKIIVFSSDRDGIFNLYTFRLGDSVIHKITNVMGSALMPVFYEGDQKIAYINYDSLGYSLYVMDTIFNLETVSLLPTLSPATNVSPPFTLNLLQSADDFSPVPKTFITWPIIYIENGASRYYRSVIKGGGGFQLSDILVHPGYPKNALSGYFLYDLSKGIYLFRKGTNSDWGLRYENRFFIPTFYTEFNQRIINEKDALYNTTLAESVTTDFYYNLKQYRLGGSLDLSPQQQIHALSTYRDYGVKIYNLDKDNQRDFTFKYSFMNSWTQSLFWTFLSAQGVSPINIRGIYLKLKADHNQDRLIKSGEFEDVFVSTDAGILRPKNDSFLYPKFSGEFRLNMPWPFLGEKFKIIKWHTLALRGQGSYIPKSIDRYFYPALGGKFNLRAYPLLLETKDSSYFLISERKMAFFSLEYRFPIIERWTQEIGPFYFGKIYANLFFEGAMGWSGNEKEIDLDKDLLKGFGGEIRVEMYTSVHFPFFLSLLYARPLDKFLNSGTERYYITISQDFDFWGLINDPDF